MDAYRGDAPWRAPRYPAYLAAATAGRVADSMWVGVVLLVLARTHDPALAGAVVAAATLPTLVSAPLIGAWLDVTAHRRAALAANEVALLAAMPPAAVVAAERPPDLRRALAGGLRVLVRTRVLRGVTTASLLGSTSFGLVTVAMPALAARLTGDASTAGGLYAAIAAGAIGGAALLPRLHGRVAPATLVYAGGAAEGVGFVALGVLPVSPLHVALCVACGVPQGLALAALFAVRIECTPPGMRAQVFTSAAGMKAGFGAAGAAASGVLVAAHGFGLALALAGAGLVGATAVGMLAGMASLRPCRSTTTAAGSATSASTSSPATPT